MWGVWKLSTSEDQKEESEKQEKEEAGSSKKKKKMLDIMEMCSAGLQFYLAKENIKQPWVISQTSHQWATNLADKLLFDKCLCGWVDLRAWLDTKHSSVSN